MTKEDWTRRATAEYVDAGGVQPEIAARVAAALFDLLPVRYKEDQWRLLAFQDWPEGAVLEDLLLYPDPIIEVD